MKRLIVCLLLALSYSGLLADRVVREPIAESVSAVVDTTDVVPSPGRLILFVHKADHLFDPNLVLDAAVDTVTIISGGKYEVSFWTVRQDSKGILADTIYVRWGRSNWSAYDTMTVDLVLPGDWGPCKYRFNRLTQTLER